MAPGRCSPCRSTPSPHPYTLPPARPQTSYGSLGPSAQVPITLHSDLVRLAKLARVAQVDLAASVTACCGGGSASPFLPFTASLEDLVSRAAVNVTAIAGTVGGGDGSGAAGGPAAEAGPAAEVLAGRLIDNGGVRDCKVRAQGGPASAGEGAAREGPARVPI
jgi:hypothetical protein